MMKPFNAIRFPHLAAAALVVASSPLLMTAVGCYKGDVVSIGHDPLARVPDDAGADDASPDSTPTTVECKVDQSGSCHCILQGVPGYGMKCGGPDGGMQCSCITWPGGADQNGSIGPAASPVPTVDIPNGTCATPETALAAYRDACGFPVP